MSKKSNPKFAELKNQIVAILHEKGAMTAAQLADFVPPNWNVTQIGAACRILAESEKVHASAYVGRLILWSADSAPGVELKRNHRHLNHQRIIDLLEKHGPMTASQISQAAHLNIASIALTCSYLQARSDICGEQVPIGNSVKMITIYSLPGQKIPYRNTLPAVPGMVSMEATLNEQREWMRNLNNERRYKAQRHVMRGRV